ncbi:hypothetical protein D3C73_1034750 [compost metagenome]
MSHYKERLLPVNSDMIKSTRNKKKSTFAMEAAAATMLKKPKIPATRAMTRKINDHLNMLIILPSW